MHVSRRSWVVTSSLMPYWIDDAIPGLSCLSLWRLFGAAMSR
jgi:hypothetical protein